MATLGAQQLIILILASVLGSIVLMIALLFLAICLWRVYKRPIVQSDGKENRKNEVEEGVGGASSGAAASGGEETDIGTLLLPRNQWIQPWLNVPAMSAKGGMRKLTREDIVHLSPLQRMDLLEVPQSKICLLTEMNETNLGKVYHGEASRLMGGEISTTVLIKSLRKMAEDPLLYQDFHTEMVWASGFDHPNILHLLGICTTEEPMYMIYEFPEFGSLSEFLKSTALVWLEMDLQSRASFSSFLVDGDSKTHQIQQQPSQQQLLGNEELVTIAIQIADALNYIACKKIVLKDIGARNCQVGEGLVVKIANFGMSYDPQSEDYCRIGSRDSRPVPLRWLAPETISRNRYSVFSDIWSYGVLLWEVFSLGERPYGQLTNAEAVESIVHHKVLEKPSHCPDNIYTIINHCWSVEPTERKNFYDLRDEFLKTISNYKVGDLSRRFSSKPAPPPMSMTATVQPTTSPLATASVGAAVSQRPSSRGGTPLEIRKQEPPMLSTDENLDDNQQDHSWAGPTEKRRSSDENHENLQHHSQLAGDVKQRSSPPTDDGNHDNQQHRSWVAEEGRRRSSLPPADNYDNQRQSSAGERKRRRSSMPTADDNIQQDCRAEGEGRRRSSMPIDGNLEDLHLYSYPGEAKSDTTI